MLTPKQKAFADEYIKSGNASEAARKAGYSGKTARQIATENLSKPSISKYIEERFKEIEGERIASADEVMRFYSSVMRGEVMDQFGLEAALGTRLKAADSLMKRYAAIKDVDKCETQSDGLMQALDARAAQLFEGGDDSAMLPEEEDDETS